MGMIIQRGEMSTKVTGGINIISSFTNMLERRVLNNPFWYQCKKGYCQMFSQKKLKRHGKFPAFLIKRLDIFRIMSLLLWKSPILHAYIVLNSTWYSGIGQEICKNSEIWTVPNPFILMPTESYHCLAVLGLFEITWWSLFTFLVEKKSVFRNCLPWGLLLGDIAGESELDMEASHESRFDWWNSEALAECQRKAYCCSAF